MEYNYLHVFELNTLSIEESVDFTNDSLFGKVWFTVFEEVWNYVIDLQFISLYLLNVDSQKVDATTTDVLNSTFILLHQNITDVLELLLHFDQSLELDSIHQTTDDSDDHVDWIDVIHFVFDWKQFLFVQYSGFISLLEVLYESIMILTVHGRHETIDLLIYDF